MKTLDYYYKMLRVVQEHKIRFDPQIKDNRLKGREQKLDNRSKNN